ncbi:MAG: nickel-responsive transcriptional regulator NikR [Eggerthellaceae bacterium]|nr:nickel-responsive transcriptional regulator NikR [Eggerthellaceae bacterium]
MNNDLVRFSVAMPEDLLMDFDAFAARRGVAKNRSEVIRDLVRDALNEEAVAFPGVKVVGTLTVTFDHHTPGLQEKLDDFQHDFFENIISTMHVHLDQHRCLEVIVLKGDSYDIRDIADSIIGTKGVTNGKLVLTTVE